MVSFVSIVLKIILVCFVVAICDQVHDIETIFHLLSFLYADSEILYISL